MKTRKYFAPAEIAQLFEHLKHRRLSLPNWKIKTDTLLLWLMLATGLRVSEALALRKKDLRFRKGKPSLRCKTKGGGKRTVILSAPMWQALKQYVTAKEVFRGPRANDFVFELIGRRGKMSRQGTWKRFKQYLAAAGLPKSLTLHSLRHTFASMLLARTSAPELVQHVLHHRSMEATARYLHHLSQGGTRYVEALLNVPLTDMAADALGYKITTKNSTKKTETEGYIA